MRHKLIYLAIVAIFFAISGKVYADEIVHIPDSAFKKALINMGVDRNNDGEIQYSEAGWYPGEGTPNGTRNGNMNILRYAKNYIKDLTGIKAFTAITKITCIYGIYISDSLDLSGLINIEEIDVVENKLKYLDVSNCTALSNLSCRENLLNELNILNCVSLTELECWDNNLTNLNLKDSKLLYRLSCKQNNITQLILPNIHILYVDYNNIQTFDASNIYNLSTLIISNNELQKLNIANGNFKKFGTMITQNNPKLECITVDNPEWAEENWKGIDDWTEFSEDCSVSVFETENTNIKIYPNPAKNNLFIKFNCEVKTDIEIYDIQGVLQSTQTVQTGYNFVNLDVSKLSKGNYFVKINNQIKKIIIE